VGGREGRPEAEADGDGPEASAEFGSRADQRLQLVGMIGDSGKHRHDVDAGIDAVLPEPSERAEERTDGPVSRAVIGHPVYVDVTPPSRFDSVSLSLRYRNPGGQTLEIGALASALERATGRGVREPLARTARRALEDDEELARQMLERWDDVVEESQDEVRLRVAALRSVPPPIARRLVERAIFRSGSPATLADVDAVLDLAEGRPGRRRDLISGLKARRERVYLSLSRTSPESRV